MPVHLQESAEKGDGNEQLLSFPSACQLILASQLSLRPPALPLHEGGLYYRWGYLDAEETTQRPIGRPCERFMPAESAVENITVTPDLATDAFTKYGQQSQDSPQPRFEEVRF